MQNFPEFCIITKVEKKYLFTQCFIFWPVEFHFYGDMQIKYKVCILFQAHLCEKLSRVPFSLFLLYTHIYIYVPTYDVFFKIKIFDLSYTPYLIPTIDFFPNLKTSFYTIIKRLNLLFN